MTATFRITAWPSRLPSVTEVMGLSPYRLEGDYLKLSPNASWAHHEVPDELYLRELYELDLADDTEILDFVNTFGRLGHPIAPVRRQEDDTLSFGRDSVLIRELGVEVPDFKELPWDEWWDEVERAPGASILGVNEKEIFFSDGLQHVDAFRGWALAFKRLTGKYKDFQSSARSDMEKVAAILTDLLSPFSPVLDVVNDEEESLGWSPFEDAYVVPRLENILALQMFNHISAGDSYHLCASESHPSRLFVRQRGRAKKGQHRSEGVIYCSAACAKAQATREYRRRRKIAKEN